MRNFLSLCTRKTIAWYLSKSKHSGELTGNQLDLHKLITSAHCHCQAIWLKWHFYQVLSDTFRTNCFAFFPHTISNLFLSDNTSGTRVGPGFRDRTLAVKSRNKFFKSTGYPRSRWKAMRVEEREKKKSKSQC